MRRSLLSLLSRPLPALTLALCLCHHPRAQSPAGTGFVRYTRLEGLSNNYISGLIQDSLGYIWVGTSKGLNRFDGRFFTSYYNGSAGLPLPSNSITQLKIQGQDIIGSTTAGAFRYDATTHTFTSFIVPVHSILSFWANDVFETTRDGKGSYVVSTKTGLFVFDSTGTVIDRYDYHKPADAGRIELLYGGSLYLPGDGTVLEESGDGFSRYNPANNHIDTDFLASDPTFKKVIFDEHGHRQMTFAEYRNRLYLFNPEQNAIQLYRFRDQSPLFLPLPFDGNKEFDGREQQIYVLNDTLLAIVGRRTGFYLMRYESRQTADCRPR